MRRARDASGDGRQGRARLPEAEAFLEALWANAPDTYGVLAFKRQKSGFLTTAFPSGSPRQGAQEAIRLSDEGFDVYTHMALADVPPGPGKRLDRATVRALNHVWAELDHGPVGHVKNSGPPDREAALDIIDGFPLAPSIVVSSGNGFHLHWILTKNLWIDDDEGEVAAAHFLRSFGAGWQQHVRSRGFEADSVFDLPRVLRVPGTRNYKDVLRPKEVRTERFSGDRYTTDDIQSVSRHFIGRRPTAAPASASAEPGRALLARLDRIEAGCGFVRHARADAATLPEPEWLMLATILTKTQDGRELFHELSRAYPAYDREETNRKYEHAATLNAYGCARISDQFEGCRRCAFSGAGGSPVDLGMPPLERQPVRVAAPLQEASALAWRGFYTHQVEPDIFLRGAVPVVAVRSSDGCYRTQRCERDQFSHLLVREVEFQWQRKGSEEVREAHPPDAILRDMWACLYPPLPLLRGISHVPLLRPDGSLAESSGYDTATRFLIGVPDGLDIPAVPETPTKRQLKEAHRLLAVELLGEFDFVGDHDFAHALAALLWPFGRSVAADDALAPLHLITKPIHGSGGTLLARALALPAFGLDIGLMAEADSDAEWRKRLTALALEGSAVVVIDNLREPLDSGSLAAALTFGRCKDRILGGNSLANIEFSPLWMATGNNPVLSGEISRRTVQIRIDPGIDRPWQRQDFKHPQLIEWARENRGNLIWAALVLWRNWIAQGRPEFDGPLLGSYETWSSTIGGVLQSAGVHGFLNNLEDLYEASDASGVAERALVLQWYIEGPERPQTAAHICELINTLDIPIELKGRTPRDQSLELGKLLGKMAGRRYDVSVNGQPATLRVEKATKASGTQRWRVVRE